MEAFNLHFNSRLMNYNLLRKIYKQQGISPRPIKYSKEFRRSKTKKRNEELKDIIAALDQAKLDNFRILYLDEQMFTYNTKPKHCYTLKGKNMVVSQDRLTVPTLALLLFVSAERGNEY